MIATAPVFPSVRPAPRLAARPSGLPSVTELAAVWAAIILALAAFWYGVGVGVIAVWAQLG